MKACQMTIKTKEEIMGMEEHQEEIQNLLILRESLLKVKINKFMYNDYKYIGLESRRIDYENDKKNGTNHIENLIEQGVYDTPTTSGCCIL